MDTNVYVFGLPSEWTLEDLQQAVDTVDIQNPLMTIESLTLSHADRRRLILLMEAYWGKIHGLSTQYKQIEFSASDRCSGAIIVHVKPKDRYKYGPG